MEHNIEKTLTQRTMYALQVASICLDSRIIVSCKPARPCENLGLHLQESLGEIESRYGRTDEKDRACRLKSFF